MTRILRSCSRVAALAVALLAVLPLPAAAQLSTDAQVKSLMNLGLAHPTTGKLLAGALVDPSTVVGASLQNTDNTLNSVTLDDEMLALRGRGLLIAAHGTLAANANAKDIELKLGTTNICAIADNTGNATDFAFLALVLESAADTQIGFCWASVNGALVAAASVGFTAAVDANATITISTTGDNNAAAASAATGKGLAVIPLGGAAR